MIYVVAFFVAAAVLGPRFGADSRDGRDWAPALLPRRRHVTRDADDNTDTEPVADTEAGRTGVPGDDDSSEPEECPHEREPAGHSPAYC
ncbi:hypothetical protein LO762_09905 [Actinocorallia sp. API 0066]|uniref:hypothetical protein n=1 Tax=Actinocorallia sp. API 0066 TaxID=2896846 RepID=UPI001E552018|nr:hypothetical protein [Actinocorallia sp. API 0066]MCD0449503.1 hypothetical protein [Actinocorallia sp. API 0066]